MSMPPILGVPADIASTIGYFLNLQDLGRLCVVSKSWHTFFSAKLRWESLLRDGSLDNLFLRTEQKTLGTWIVNNSDGNKKLKGATIDSCIDSMLGIHIGDITVDLTPMILITCLFCSAQEILSKLIERYLATPPSAKDKLRVCRILYEWVSMYFPPEFLHGPSSSLLTCFLRAKVVLDEEPYCTMGVSILKVLMEKQNGIQLPTIPTHQLLKPSTLPKDLKEANINLMDIPSEEIARQLTLMEYELIFHLSPSELLHKENRGNVFSKCVARFNKLSSWISTWIVSTEKLNDRVKVMSKVLDILGCLAEMNNFNDAVCFISALQCASVARLMHTHSCLNHQDLKKLSKFQKLFSTDKSYAALREAYAEASLPKLPYLGMISVDISFIKDGNPEAIFLPSDDLKDPMGKPLINIVRASHCYQALKELLLAQSTPYPFQPIPAILGVLATENLPSLDEKEQYNMSIKVEPRGCSRKDIK